MPLDTRLKAGAASTDAASVPMTVLTPPPTTLPATTPVALWHEYHRTGDARTRNRLVFTLAPLVRHAGALTDAEAASGLQALLAAVEGYEPGRDGQIERHVWRAIRAALA